MLQWTRSMFWLWGAENCILPEQRNIIWILTWRTQRTGAMTWSLEELCMRFWFVIRNMHLVFYPFLSRISGNPQNFLRDEKNRDALVMIMWWLGWLSVGQGSVARGTTHLMSRLELLVPPSHLWGRERDWRLTSPPMASDSTNHT